MLVGMLLLIHLGCLWLRARHLSHFGGEITPRHVHVLAESETSAKPTPALPSTPSSTGALTATTPGASSFRSPTALGASRALALSPQQPERGPSRLDFGWPADIATVGAGSGTPSTSMARANLDSLRRARNSRLAAAIDAYVDAATPHSAGAAATPDASTPCATAYTPSVRSPVQDEQNRLRALERVLNVLRDTEAAQQATSEHGQAQQPADVDIQEDAQRVMASSRMLREMLSGDMSASPGQRHIGSSSHNDEHQDSGMRV